MNRLTSSRSGLLDQPDDVSTVIGLNWLNHDRPYPIYRPAVRKQGRFEYSMGQQRPAGPFHPQHSKSALVCITRGGVVRLIYQTPESGWLEVRAELESMSSSDHVLSHASMCSDEDNNLLLVVRSVSHELRLYRLQIQWSMQPSQKLLPPPAITVRQVKTSFPPNRKFDSASPDTHSEDVAPSELTHLEMIPTVPKREGSESPHPPTYPTILAVHSGVPKLDDSEAESLSSSISRWELLSTPQRLHSSFDQLTSKKNGTTAADQYGPEIQQVKGLTISKTVLSIQPIQMGTIYMLTNSDGSVEYRDRISLDMIPINERSDTIHSMLHSGFAMPPDEPCLHLALSPNFCLAVARDADEGIRLRTMQYTFGDVAGSLSDPKSSTIVTALALQFVYSCAHHNNNDDLGALVRQLPIPNIGLNFLSEIYRAMNMSVDYSVEPQHEKLFRNPMIQRCLSMQNALSYKGEKTCRNLNGKLAWQALHLRLVALTFAFSFNSGNKAGGDRGNSESEFVKPEVLHVLMGIVRYFVDFTNLFIDELFELANYFRDHKLTLVNLQEHLTSINAPALPLLLSSIPRTLIKYNARGIRVLRTTLVRMFDPSNPARTTLNDQTLRSTLTTLITMIDKSPVNMMTDFERFLTNVDGFVKEAYARSAITDAGRRQAEKTLLISATIPPSMLNAIGKIVGPLLGGMRFAINPADLYFADYSWLGLSDDKRTELWTKTHVVDAIRKIELAKGTPLRRCTRCCALMEDLKPQKGASVWMTTIQKMCLCGSLWMLFDESDKG